MGFCKVALLKAITMRKIVMYRVFTVIMLVIPVIALFIFFISFRYGKNISETTASVIHAQNVISNSKELVILTLHNGQSARDFVNTGDEKNIASLPANSARMVSMLREIDSLHGADILHQGIVDSLKFYVQKRVEFSEELIRLNTSGQKDEAKALLYTEKGKIYTDNVERIAKKLEIAELENLAGQKIKYIKGVFYLRAILISVISLVFIAGILVVRRLRREMLAHIGSEEKFKALLESAPDATVITNEEGLITMINKQAETLFGHHRDKMLGKPVEMLMPGVHRSSHEGFRLQYLRKPVERQMGGAKEMQALKSDGSLIPVEISLSPIQTAEGLFISASVRDITVRKAAQAQMELMFHQINQAHEAIYIINGDMQIESWNHGAELLYGYKREEAIGKKSTELLDTHLNDAEYQAAYKEITEKGYWSGEVKRKTKEGKGLIVYSSLTAIRGKDGKVSGYVSLSYDLTENKKLNEQVNFLATVVEQSAEAIVSFDENNRILTWNKGAEKLFGYTEQEMLGFGHKTSNVRFNLSREGLKSKMSDFNRTGVLTGELVFTRKDGSSFHGSISGNIIYGDNGEIFSRVYFVRDITSKKVLEEQLVQANISLEKKVEERAGELKRSEEQYRHMFENNPMPMWVFDPVSLFILAVNDAAIKLYGYTKDEFLKLKIVDIRPEEDKIRFNSRENQYEMNNSSSSKGVWRHLKKNGEVMDVEVIAYASVYEGKPARLILINDITEVKKAGDRLISSEKRFRALIENNNDIVSLMDVNNKIIYCSPSAARITGWPDEEFFRMNFFTEVLHLDDKGRIVRLFEDLKSKPGIPVSTSFRIKHKQGYYIDVEVVMTNLLNDEHINAIVINTKDITKRKQAEDRLMKSEMRFRSLIENNSDVIGLLDERGKFTYGSPSATRVTGWTAEEYSKPGFLTKVIHPEDVRRLTDLIEEVKSKPGKSIETSTRILHKNGYYIYIEGSMINLLHAEFISAIVFNYRDISERKEAEEKLTRNEKRFRSMIENSYDMVDLMDENFNITYRSPSAIRLTGNADNEILHTSALSKVHPDDIPELKEKMKGLLGIPGGGGMATFRYLTKDGAYVWMEGTATNLLHEEAVKAIVFNYRDVSERIEAEKLIRESEERYRSTLDNMIEGVQIIGHDWRYKYVNDAVASHARMKKEELLGFTMLEKFPGMEHSGLYNGIKRCFEDNVPVTMENEFLYPDGTVSWFQLSIQPVPEGVFILSVDITEKMIAEQKLQEEKDKLATIALTAPGVIYSFRMKPDGTLGFPYVSNAVEDVFGLAHDDIKESIEGIINNMEEEDKEVLITSIFESARTLSPWRLEFRYRHPVMGMLWLEGNSIPARETDGSVIWYGVLTNVTQRKRSQEEIRQSNERFEMVAKATKDIVWDLNPETNEIWWNENYYTFFGYEKDGANQLTSAWEQHIHPEDKERVISNFSKYFERKEPLWKDEYRFIKKNGEIAYIYDCGYILYNEKGKPYRVVGSMIDITEITEAQRELRETLDENMLLTGRLSTILNTLPAQIALLDSDGSILDVNDEWKSFTMECGFAGKQYGIGEDYIAFSGDSLGGEVEKSMVSEGIRRVLEGRTEEFVHEYFCPRCKKQQWFKMVVTPLKGKENNGAVVMHIDISEIKRLEEERIKSKTEEQRKITEAMLKGQEKERNAIGIELHDNVNQILVGTKVLLSVVRDFPDKREELVPSCIDNINMAIQENRKIAHELVTPNLSNEDLIKQIRRLGDTMLKNAGINAHIKHDRFNEELLNNDMKLAVYRVAQEQCTNIIKYADAGHVVFSLKTADNHFFMRITDDGKGMDKENVTHGIGLKNIASRLGVFGGTINVETEPGEGFTLEIDIPLNNISEQEVSPSVP